MKSSSLPSFPSCLRSLLPWLGVGLLSAMPPVARADTGTFTTLYRFSADTDGNSPEGDLVQGRDGNFYGTTRLGGTSASGTVFRMTPAGVLTTLHSFNTTDGALPTAALVQGSDGSFYGTTSQGGPAAGGTVFQITPAGVFTSLHSFNYNDGKTPYGGLVQGSDGSFYGTTSQGGMYGTGVVFRITPAGATTTLHSFVGSEGTQPRARLLLARDGNFYGTTSQGGTSNDGTVFRLTPAGALTVLHTFTGSDGGNPAAGLVQGADGSFYGTTSDSNVSNGNGRVFRVTAAGGFSVLYSFNLSAGTSSLGDLVLGSDGNFYGTTPGAGYSTDFGAVYQITPAGAVTVLHNFAGTDGETSVTGLVQGSDGSFYGTTSGGGTGQNGTVFKLATGLQKAHPAFFTGEIALASGVYYLTFPGGNPFGYYAYLDDPDYIYHFDLGYEYVFDAADGHSGVYLYDFKSGGFFYTSPTFPFPYLYDFTLNSVVYYYPDPNNAGRYNTNGVRFFYVFRTAQTISK